MRGLDDILIQQIPTGTHFEDDFEEAFILAGKDIHKVVGTDDDIKKGTDFIIEGLRWDTTINILDKNDKKVIPFLYETPIEATRFQNFYIGIRHGNRHAPDDKRWKEHYTEFDEPVIVVGLDMEPAIYRQFQCDIVANLHKNADILCNIGQDAYYDFTITDMEERKELSTQPLRCNPNYRKPIHIGTDFNQIYNLQKTLIPSKPDYTIADFV